jgi:hypothetical protein
MSSSKSVRTRHFATGGATAAIEGRDPSFSVHGLSASTNNTAANDNRHMTIDIERQPTGSDQGVTTEAITSEFGQHVATLLWK